MFKSLALNEYPPNIGETVMVWPLGICRIVPDGGILSLHKKFFYICGKGVRPTEAKMFIPFVPCGRKVVPHPRPIFWTPTRAALALQDAPIDKNGAGRVDDPCHLQGPVDARSRDSPS